ncbi:MULTISPECIES: response regulator [Desulfosediminicola]|uniref:response regulator n=1 Tax=Desulfosediminicola TaxID=2886823 RepID=UPI0010AC801C|nr:two-component system response regulator [Desulfosediminicola ganghwensis]
MNSLNSNRYKILLVDDTPVNLKLLGQILDPEYEVFFAEDGETAIELAGTVRPDLILLDVIMPGLNGYDVCRHLKAQHDTANIPVLFVTSMGELEDERRGFEAGGVDYITKPISPSIVLARVQTHLALYNQSRLLEDMVEQRTKQLKQALETIKNATLETIHRLSMAAEYKDKNTGAHIQRMSHYSAALARQMGLTDGEVENIFHSAPMHDVGKIGIPDRILLKPGKLDADEWKIMKQHTTLGGKLLKSSTSKFFKTAEIIALTHHEKWEGSGYPKGLKGREIPLVGRIVAIADVFDALTVRRPYKDPFSLKKSYAIIQDKKGKHFDPDVVDAFFAIKDELISIKGKFQNKGISSIF